MKPFYKSKKFWASVATIIAVVVGDEKYGALITAIGAAFVIATGLADMHKEAKAMELEE